MVLSPPLSLSFPLHFKILPKHQGKSFPLLWPHSYLTSSDLGPGTRRSEIQLPVWGTGGVNGLTYSIPCLSCILNSHVFSAPFSPCGCLVSVGMENQAALDSLDTFPSPSYILTSFYFLFHSLTLPSPYCVPGFWGAHKRGWGMALYVENSGANRIHTMVQELSRQDWLHVFQGHSENKPSTEWGSESMWGVQGKENLVCTDSFMGEGTGERTGFCSMEKAFQHACEEENVWSGNEWQISVGEAECCSERWAERDPSHRNFSSRLKSMESFKRILRAGPWDKAVYSQASCTGRQQEPSPQPLVPTSFCCLDTYHFPLFVIYGLLYFLTVFQEKFMCSKNSQISIFTWLYVYPLWLPSR